jgi:signal transduction histidine kinase
MRLHPTAINLSEELTELVMDIEMSSPELKVKAQIEAGLVIQADQALLTQVLQNLITNAIKYNITQGWIRIEARRQKQRVCVTVTNSSKDIPARERNRIFERFHRGRPDHTHQIEGLGLGLSLSREIALAHGGSLTLDPTPKEQTAFTLTLPA